LNPSGAKKIYPGEKIRFSTWISVAFGEKEGSSFRISTEWERKKDLPLDGKVLRSKIKELFLLWEKMVKESLDHTDLGKDSLVLSDLAEKIIEISRGIGEDSSWEITGVKISEGEWEFSRYLKGCSKKEIR